MNLTFLLTKLFGVFTKKNLEEDFEVMATRAKLTNDPEIRKLCFTWFCIGHINSADKTSNFITKQFGEVDTKKVH